MENNANPVITALQNQNSSHIGSSFLRPSSNTNYVSLNINRDSSLQARGGSPQREESPRDAPSQRQQGVATAMLRSALIKCTEFEIMKAMLICDSDNVGSRRAIEANNGILQREENGQRWYLIKL